MKIAFIVEEFPKISETFVLNQATSLIDMGHKVDIFYFNLGDIKIMHSDIQRYELLEKAVCLDPLYVYADRIGITRRAFEKKFSKKVGFKLPSLKLSRYVRSLLSVLILLKFRYWRRKKNERYDVIHCQFGTSGLRFLPLYRLRILGGKLVVQFRGHDLTEIVKQKGDRVYSKLFEEVDYFLPVCDYLRKKAIKLGCPEDKIAVLHCGVDLHRFKFRKRRKPVGATKIVFIGRLVEIKGVEYAIRALSILKKQGYKAKLLVVGDGILKIELQELSKELNVDKSITFLGAKNREGVVKVLNSAHLFVAPSLTSRTGCQEGSPDVLKEAMAVGLPVVSTYHAGIPELVEDGTSGFLVPERNPQLLAEKLGYLIDHPERWSKMGRAGRQFVEKNYDKEKLNRQLVGIYKRLVGL